jgi:hypothetical protein
MPINWWFFFFDIINMRNAMMRRSRRGVVSKSNVFAWKPVENHKIFVHLRQWKKITLFDAEKIDPLWTVSRRPSPASCINVQNKFVLPTKTFSIALTSSQYYSSFTRTEIFSFQILSRNLTRRWCISYSTVFDHTLKSFDQSTPTSIQPSYQDKHRQNDYVTGSNSIIQEHSPHNQLVRKALSPILPANWIVMPFEKSPCVHEI